MTLPPWEGGPGDPPATIEAVLFDKDGTLSHSEPMLEALARRRVTTCLRLVEERQAAPADLPQLEDLLRRAYGLSPEGIHPAGATAVGARDHNLLSTATTLAQVGFGWPAALALAEEVFAATDACHGEGSEHRPQATEGLVDFLEDLHAAGVRCAVISNDQEDGIRSFLGSQGLTHHFSALWSAEHRPRKPEPGAVHGLCRELDLSPERCALIGDADSDLHMARAAGVAVVLGYRSGWRRETRLDPAFPHLDHWREIAVGHPSRAGGISSQAIRGDQGS